DRKPRRTARRRRALPPAVGGEHAAVGRCRRGCAFEGERLMFRTVIGLLPAEQRGRVAGYLALNVVSTLVRAVAVVLVVPLVAELFGDDPGAAWRWVGLLTLAVAVGWVVDSIGYRIGFDLGFGILDNAQRSVAAEVARIPLRGVTGENSTPARRAIASPGADRVGLVGYLLTPLIQGVLLPIAIAIALVPIAWQLGLVA